MKADPGAAGDKSLVIGNMLPAAYSPCAGSCWIHRAGQVFDDPWGTEILKSAGLHAHYIGICNMAPGCAKVQPGKIIPGRENRVFLI